MYSAGREREDEQICGWNAYQYLNEKSSHLGFERNSDFLSKCFPISLARLLSLCSQKQEEMIQPFWSLRNPVTLKHVDKPSQAASREPRAVQAEELQDSPGKTLSHVVSHRCYRGHDKEKVC